MVLGQGLILFVICTQYRYIKRRSNYSPPSLLRRCSLDAAQRNQGLLPTAAILDYAALHQGYSHNSLCVEWLDEKIYYLRVLIVSNKVKGFFCVFILLMINQVFADAQNPLVTPKDYLLKPGEAIVLVNTTSAPLSAQCQIFASSTAVNTLSIQMLYGNGVFNGTSIKQGGTLFQTLRNLQVVNLSATGGAKARFANVGEYAIQAYCS